MKCVIMYQLNIDIAFQYDAWEYKTIEIGILSHTDSQVESVTYKKGVYVNQELFNALKIKTNDEVAEWLLKRMQAQFKLCNYVNVKFVRWVKK